MSSYFTVDEFKQAIERLAAMTTTAVMVSASWDDFFPLPPDPAAPFRVVMHGD